MRHPNGVAAATAGGVLGQAAENMGGKRAEAQARIDAAKRAAAEKKAAAEAAQKAEAAAHLFRGENEILLDEICSDLRRGLPFGLEKLMKHHMQGKVDVQAKDEFGC